MVWGGAWGGAWAGAWGQIIVPPDPEIPPPILVSGNGSGGRGGFIVGGRNQKAVLANSNKHLLHTDIDDIEFTGTDLLAVAQILITSGILECL